MNFKRNRFRTWGSGTATLVELLIVIAILGISTAFMLPTVAQAQPGAQFPNSYILDRGFAPLLLTNNQTITFTAGGTGTNSAGLTNSLVKYIRQDKGITLFLETVQTNSVASTTTNYSLKFDVNVDGTNWTTGVAPPITWTVPYIGGVSTNRFWTNLPPTFINNIRAMQVTSASTTASNNVVTRFWYSQSQQP